MKLKASWVYLFLFIQKRRHASVEQYQPTGKSFLLKQPALRVLAGEDYDEGRDIEEVGFSIPINIRFGLIGTG